MTLDQHHRRLHSVLSSDTGLTVLVVSLFTFLFVIYPFVPLNWAGRFAVSIVFTVILASGLLSLRHQKHLVTIGFVLGALALILLWLHHFIPVTSLLIWSRASGVLFLILTAGGVITRVLRSGPITMHRIQGAIACYLIIGLIWGYVYSLVEILDPGAFDMTVATDGWDPQAESVRDFIYFSFVTLTTLGYGDITPVSSVARHLTILEALIGQLYTVILVAHLVGLQVARLDRGD